jgi:hypothetical protein
VSQQAARDSGLGGLGQNERSCVLERSLNCAQFTPEFPGGTRPGDPERGAMGGSPRRQAGDSDKVHRFPLQRKGDVDRPPSPVNTGQKPGYRTPGARSEEPVPLAGGRSDFGGYPKNISSIAQPHQI